MKRRRRRAAIALLVPVVLILAYAAVCAPRWRDEANIREAVFRYQMTKYAPRGAVCYLSEVTFGFDRDPSRGFLGRFAGAKQRVRGVSRCTAEADGVRDRRTLDDGIILQVGRVAWVSRNVVEVDGGYFEHGTSASGNVYTVVRRHGRWVVVNDRVIWIS